MTLATLVSGAGRPDGSACAARLVAQAETEDDRGLRDVRRVLRNIVLFSLVTEAGGGHGAHRPVRDGLRRAAGAGDLPRASSTRSRRSTTPASSLNADNLMRYVDDPSSA